MRSQKLLEQRHLVALRRAEPDQRKAPGFIGVAAHVVVRCQLGQGADAVGAGGRVTRQMLGQEQRHNRVVRPLAGQTLQAGDGLVRALGREAQGVVILAGKQALRLAPLEDLAIQRHRLFALFFRLAEFTGLFQQLGVGRDVDGDVLLQQQGLARYRAQRLQAGQVLLRFGRTLLLHLDQADAVQRIRLFGAQAQQFLPGLEGAFRVLFRLPVIALLDQQALRVSGFGKAGAGSQGRQNRNG